MSVFTSADHFKNIVMYLSILRYILKSNSKRGLFDDNKAAEDFFKELLNEMYNWELENLNQIQVNFPAIDLGDSVNKICIQVTAENGASKLQGTLNTFFEHKLDNKYDRLIILLLSEKKSYKKVFKTLRGFKFDRKADIIDTDGLLFAIEKSNFSKIQQLHEIIETRLKPLTSSLVPDSSLLSNIASFVPTMPEASDAFCGYLDVSGDELADQEVCIDSFISELKKLTQKSRELLFALVYLGKSGLENVSGGNLHVISQELANFLSLDDFTIYTQVKILEDRKLAYINEGFDGLNYIEVSYPPNGDYDLIANLKGFLKGDEEKLKQLLINGDFSLLD